jgi:tripartite-type tricarboxylate transporter receptor subunit TctC
MRHSTSLRAERSIVALTRWSKWRERSMQTPKALFAILAVVTALDLVTPAHPQDYPLRPISMVIPFPAGGPLDTIGRIMAEAMRGSLGQPVIIENVTGAAGSLGVGRVARAAADGHTLCLGIWSTHVVNGAIYALPYDMLNDFEPVALLTSVPLLILARKAMPGNDLNGLIAWLKANPDTASWGTQGAGGPSHIGGVFFEHMTGARYQFVPYRGLAHAIQDLVAGQIDILLAPPDTSLPHLRAGTIKAYAVTAESRLATVPDIPTVDEAGLPGFYFSIWTAIWAPKRTPKHVIGKLNAAVMDGLANPAVRSRLADAGVEIFPREQQTPAALAAYQKAEIEKWWPIIKAANIKPE